MRRLSLQFVTAICAMLPAFSVATAVVRAEDSPQAQTPGPPAADADAAPAMFAHSESDRWWISGQANFISQWHPAFRSPYQGVNSLTPEAQDATSRVLTLFTGLQLTGTTELLCDTRTPFSLSSALPVRRLEIRFGKFSIVDFFDANAYGSDTNFQFMNWTVDNNGTYDYAADTRGFTFAAMVEYHDRRWAVRFAEALMPKIVNGIHLDADVSRAHAENIEFEVHGTVVRQREGIVRFLSFVNHANMGSYSEAVEKFFARITPSPEITAHPAQTTVKYGFAANFEQPLNDWVGIFGRWGWNEGQHESFAYTEVDQTAQIGVGGNGRRWSRKFDRAGLVFVSNGISRDHQEYLALGGSGFLLGDGRLNYRRESIVETYYTLHAWRGIYPSFGLQHLNNPGYNRDRGPVVVPTLRLHLEF